MYFSEEVNFLFFHSSPLEPLTTCVIDALDTKDLGDTRIGGAGVIEFVGRF